MHGRDAMRYNEIHSIRGKQKAIQQRYIRNSDVRCVLFLVVVVFFVCLSNRISTQWWPCRNDWPKWQNHTAKITNHYPDVHKTHKSLLAHYKTFIGGCVRTAFDVFFFSSSVSTSCFHLLFLFGLCWSNASCYRFVAAEYLSIVYERI